MKTDRCCGAHCSPLQILPFLLPAGSHKSQWSQLLRRGWLWTHRGDAASFLYGLLLTESAESGRAVQVSPCVGRAGARTGSPKDGEGWDPVPWSRAPPPLGSRGGACFSGGWTCLTSQRGPKVPAAHCTGAWRALVSEDTSDLLTQTRRHIKKKKAEGVENCTDTNES